MDLLKEFRRRFNGLAEGLQSDMQATVATHLEIIRSTFDMIRSENVASESEQNPEFRRHVDIEITAAKDAIQRIQEVVGS
jgi:phage-related protein